MDQLTEKKAIVANLIKNTDVLEMQFDSYGLKVSSIGYNVLDGGNYWLEAFVEIVSTGSAKLKDDYQVKVNLYNEHGHLIGNEDEGLYASDFNGFETFTFSFLSNGISLEVQKARIFITKE